MSRRDDDGGEAAAPGDEESSLEDEFRNWADSAAPTDPTDDDLVGDDETPASVGDIDVGFAVAAVSVGGGHVCARSAGGQVRCWGDGAGGRLGYRNTDNIGDDETPASAGDVDIGANATQVEAAGQHSCAIVPGGALRCWGYGGDGALGYGNTNDIGDDEAPATAPIEVPATTSGASPAAINVFRIASKANSVSSEYIWVGWTVRS